jgi:DNA repair protein RecN (Recombination protein N)
LLDVGAQHEQIALLDPARQGELFDDFAQVAPQKRAVEHAFSEVRRLEHEIAAGNRADSEREQRRDFLRFRIQELESASLQPGEKEKLEAELQRLSHHERLVEFLSASLQALSENPDGGAVATDLIARAMGSVESSSRLDPSLAPLIDQLAQAHSLISEAAYEIGRYLNKADVDPGRVDEVIARLELLKKVLRRHGPTEQEALSALGLMQEELHRLEDWEAMRDGLAKEHATALQRLQAAAGELRNARLQQAPGFQRPLVAILKDFAMPKVRFEVAFTPCTEGVALGEGSHCRATGTEEVEFLFSANEGEPLLPLRRTASGGELSRLLLALRTITAQPEASPLMVFDEVDAGVSGAAARAVAQRLAALGSRTQILCVTHNASVAAAAQNHVLVEKETIEGRTLSRARLLAMESRRSELARLLEGGVQSGLGLALADQLLSGAAG